MDEAAAEKKADSDSVPSTIAKAGKVISTKDGILWEEAGKASTPADMSAPVSPPLSLAPPTYSLLSISPAGPTGDELAVLAPKFEPGATEPVMVPSAMTITNKSEENVLFKIKINFGKEYCTLKPCFGRLLPGESEEVLITLKVLPILPCKFHHFKINMA